MSRTGLLVALSLTAASGIAFGVFPSLDLALSQTFYRGPIRDASGGMLAWYVAPPFPLLKNIVVKGTLLLVIPALLALLLKLFVPQRKMFVNGRATIFLISALIIGPGLIVNAGLKENWGRPRPLNVTEFGGPQHFVAWWKSNWRLRKKLFFCFGRCRHGYLGNSACSAPSAALADNGDRSIPRRSWFRGHDTSDGGWPFSYRCDFWGSNNLRIDMAHLRNHIPMAKHPFVGQRSRRSDRVLRYMAPFSGQLSAA